MASELRVCGDVRACLMIKICGIDAGLSASGDNARGRSIGSLVSCTLRRSTIRRWATGADTSPSPVRASAPFAVVDGQSGVSRASGLFFRQSSRPASCLRWTRAVLPTRTACSPSTANGTIPRIPGITAEKMTGVRAFLPPLNEHWQVPHQEGHQLAGSDLGRGAHFPSHRRCSPPLTFLICIRCRRSTTTSRPARWRDSSSRSTCTTGTSWVRRPCRCVT